MTNHSVPDILSDKNLPHSDFLPNFAPVVLTTKSCPDGGIGRRAGLKHQWSNPSRFDPGSGYKGKAERMIIHCLAFPFLLTSSLNQIDAYFVVLLLLKWERY